MAQEPIANFSPPDDSPPAASLLAQWRYAVMAGSAATAVAWSPRWDRDNPPRESSVAANRAPRRNREWWRPVLAGSRGSKHQWGQW